MPFAPQLKYSLAFLLLLVGASAWATHNRAGEITYRHLEGLVYEITITTCTKTSSDADREWLTLEWGDEDSNEQLDSLQRESITPVQGEDAQINVYRGTHSYPGIGSYWISIEDPNRNSGILNIFSSVTIPFFIRSELIISPALGNNNSVQLLNGPKEQACLNSLWIHNPGAFDPDGDMLRYSLVEARGEGGQVIPQYLFPDQYVDEQEGNLPDVFAIDPITGDVTWDVPPFAGEFNIAILIEEFRDGDLSKKVGSVLRDMQITVDVCNNQPPIINPLPDYCVVEGEQLSFTVTFSDPNGDNVELDAIGAMVEPPQVENEATFNANTGQFVWAPKCAEVRLEPYQVLFTAEDDGVPTALTDIESVFIQVIAGPVDNLTTDATASSISIDWDAHTCAGSTGDVEEMVYKVYRKINPSILEVEECETGMPEDSEFELVEVVAGGQNTGYIDEDTEQGVSYCYRVVACFEDGSESIVSDEICNELLGEAALLTQASVLSTDTENGEVEVRWIEPQELDLTKFPGPYRFDLFYNEGFNEGAEVLIFQSESFPTFDFSDLVYSHAGLNTQDQAHSYRVELFSGEVSTGQSGFSSTIFLTIEPNDNQLTLNFNYNVAWFNESFQIFRQNIDTGVFESIATASEPTYVDTDLTNLQEYCYFVRATGGYVTLTNLPDFINDSQIACGVPYDLDPPCPPALAAEAFCEEGFTELQWTNPNETCADDVQQFNLYYAPFEGDPFELLVNFEDTEDLDYLFAEENNIAGCFYITSLDSLNPQLDGSVMRNEGLPSDTVCVDNCPIYELPNVITPNGDGVNDTFVPLKEMYIDSVAFSVFNRWGELIWQTNEVGLGWNATRQDDGQLITAGTYYYTATVFRRQLVGLVEENISGFISVVDAQQATTE